MTELFVTTMCATRYFYCEGKFYLQYTKCSKGWLHTVEVTREVTQRALDAERFHSINRDDCLSAGLSLEYAVFTYEDG